MSVRKISVQEIQAVGALVKDQNAINLLKEVRNQTITGEDLKGKHKGNNLENFVGFALESDLIGEGDQIDAGKKISLQRLVDLGLVLEGYHIALPRKTQKNEGVQVPTIEDDLSRKYQLTETGLALLASIDPKFGNTVEEKPGNEQQKVNKGYADEALGRSKKNQKEFVPPKIEGAEPPQPEQKKANKARFPQGESSKTNGNDIEEFKAEQNKELGK